MEMLFFGNQLSPLLQLSLLFTIFRSAVTFLCGIFVYGVTWILLGQSSEQTLNPGVWKQFMVSGTQAK